MTGTGRIGVAISTTGDEHRMGFLETCVRKWCEIDEIHSLFVTVDGSVEAAQRVADAVQEHTGSVYRVGQSRVPGFPARDGRLGVAVNKNTGLELLMNAQGSAGYPDIEHLFLCDDDTWPVSHKALRLHTESQWRHSMVCWGKGRLKAVHPGALQPYAEWSWPRGVLLYTHRSVVSEIGGMDERFGPGGHEHVDWSRRIYAAGFTVEPFLSPHQYAYATKHGPATGAAAYWHAEDMPRIGEHGMAHRHRKRAQTSIRRVPGDWPMIEAVLASNEGDTRFVPFRADSNRRFAATLCSADPTGRGAGGATK